MKHHFQYLKYVIRHKWFVFQECRKLGIFWAGVWHDWSKFRHDEWFPYANFFHGDGPSWTDGWLGWLKDGKDINSEFDVAWLKHQNRNPHHWQYWVIYEDCGVVKPLPMPDRYRREMLADWRGAGRAINGKDDTKTWYLRKRGNMYLHTETRQWVEQMLGITW